MGGGIKVRLLSNREEKSLHHVAMVAKFLDDNKLIRSLKSLFALFQTSLNPYSISFNLANLGEIFFGPYLSLENESDSFCVVFTSSIKWAHEIRTFHVIVVQQQQRNVQNSMTNAHAKLLFVKISILFFAVLLAVAIIVGFVVIQK